MSKRAKEDENDPFLRVDGVATRFAIEQLRTAGIDPEPLLAKAGISVEDLLRLQRGFRRKINFDFWKLPLMRLTVRISDFVSPSKGTFERVAFSIT